MRWNSLAASTIARISSGRRALGFLCLDIRGLQESRAPPQREVFIPESDGAVNPVVPGRPGSPHAPHSLPRPYTRPCIQAIFQRPMQQEVNVARIVDDRAGAPAFGRRSRLDEPWRHKSPTRPRLAQFRGASFLSRYCGFFARFVLRQWRSK